ncbi:MAG: ribonuclease PH [Bdellovibrionales bacterium]|nr:ribonuclease PH [Oligoflexia bacterium]
MRERSDHEPRPCTILVDVSRYAEGSCMIETGHTKVFCTASIEEDVPKWLKEKKSGWITAEYSMLPRATHTRSKRDREKVSGRTQEIQRLIGRAIRAMVDLNKLGERQIIVDCDVIQADGGTRTAAITGACVAVGVALSKLIKAGKVKPDVFVDTVQAISVGLKDGKVLVDLDYDEDSTCDVDMNFVRTGSGLFVEVQGTAERKPFSEEDLKAMMVGAHKGLDSLRAHQIETLKAFGL